VLRLILPPLPAFATAWSLLKGASWGQPLKIKKSAFEIWRLPKTHDSCFEGVQKREYQNLSRNLKSALLRIDQVPDHPPYNLVIHTSPITETLNDFYHWHIEIMPKLSKVAGFEWGTGFYINPVPPEESARLLREAMALGSTEGGSKIEIQSGV